MADHADGNKEIDAMLEIKQSVGAVVADDTKSSIAALDQALSQQSHLCVSLVEAAQHSGLAVAVTQPLFESLTTSMRGLVDSRAHLSDAVREIAKIQSRSNLRETSFGCPNGWAHGKVLEGMRADCQSAG